MSYCTLCLRLIFITAGIVLLQACYSTRMMADINEERFPTQHGQGQEEMESEAQRVSVIFPIGQEYEQHNDECWGHEASGAIGAIQ